MSSTRIADFDVWRAGYGSATVRVLLAGTTTLADVFSDEDLTVAVDNPITLAERTEGGIAYGKFSAPVYVGVPYELQINSVDNTGVIRPPLTTLDAEDASLAVVTPDGASESSTLEALFARVVDVRDYGDFLGVGEVGASTATNTLTLTTAIGVAGGRGGGFVDVPSGTYQVSQFTLPEGVVLRGVGRDATVLRSTQGGTVATLSGDAAGFTRMTLDGVSQVALSVGILADAVDRLVMDDVLIKRFETGIQRDGGSYAFWHALWISDCVNGYKAYATDDDLLFNVWLGGGVELCSTRGIDLQSNGSDAIGNVFQALNLEDNTGTAVRIEGAKSTSLRDNRFDGNTTNLAVLDDAASDLVGLEILGGSMNTGALTFTGHLENVILRNVRMTDIDVTITTPTNRISAQDCEEDGVSITGNPTNWSRYDTGDDGSTFGTTTGNAATKAWSVALDPGDHVYLQAFVIGRQINAVQHGFYHIAVSARRPGSSLAYDTQTGNFTAGRTLTGGTSGATAVIQADSDSGTTGTLTLIDIVGTFVDNEIITDGAGGSATVNGALVAANAALVGSVTALRAAQETVAGWDATFAANGFEIELQVTGAASSTVEWTSRVKVTRN